jgi:TonB-linked SusC/RagA family outer membrane protein
MKLNMKNRLKTGILLFLFSLTISLSAQNSPNKVSGRVTDTQNELIIGAIIEEKGTSNGTVTDMNGIYNLVLTTQNPVLLVSYMGYIKQEKKVNASLMDFILKEDIAVLDEVQVIGYGTQKKVSVVGAQSSLKMETIKAPVANMSTILAGRVSGLVAVQRSGVPGHDDADIWIRGISTLTNVNQGPLVLVDGIERSFNQLDPEDIESVTVLKDASSTAVYGVRGGNGVIIITTKPGVVSEPKFTFDYYEGVSRFTQLPKLVDAYQYMDAVNEAYLNTPNVSKGKVFYSDQYILNTQMANGLLPNTGGRTVNKYLYPDVNWLDELYNKWGYNRRANMNIRGGAPNASYYISLSYYDEKGLTKTDPTQTYSTEITFNRYNFLSNINLKASQKTVVDVGVNGWFSSGNYPSQDLTEIFTRAMNINPVLYPVKYPDGKNPGASPHQRELDNPYVWLTNRGYKTEYKTQINSNLKLTQNLDFLDWTKGLKIHALIAYDVRDNQDLNYKKDDSTWKPLGSINADTGVWEDDVLDADGNFRFDEQYKGNPSLGYESLRNSYRTFYFETALNYNRLFDKMHQVTGLVLFNLRDYRDPNHDSYYASLPYKQMGISSRFTYAFGSRYFFEANAGYTGSENFSPGERFGFFPALAVGWVPSNEIFWESIAPFISFLKFRYSDGVVGNDSMGDERFGFETEIAGKPGYSIHGSQGNDNDDGLGIDKYGYRAQWSTIRKQDLGIEINFLKNELSLVFDFFKEHRDKIYVTRYNLPSSAGFATRPTANKGMVDNKGFEASFDYNHQFAQDWNISVRGNFTMNEDKIIENEDAIPAYPWMDKRGRNVLVRMGYIAEGLYASDDEIKERNIKQFGESFPGELTKAGDIKYKDLNGDNRIDAYDRTAIGRGDVPKYYFGFGGDFRYKNVGLGILFQGTAGADRVLEGSGIRPFTSSSGGGTLYANIEDRWKPDNPANDNVFYPRIAWGGDDASNYNNFQTSTWWQKDMSFLRLKQFTLSYYFPKAWSKKTFLNGGRFYIMGSNVFTWSKFKLWDPELNTNNGINYPNISAYTLGVNFSF